MAYILDSYDPILNVKDGIMKKLINSNEIYELINDPTLEYPDDMAYTHIFPFLVDPTVIQDVTNNIYYEAIDNGSLAKHNFLDNFFVDFLAVCSSEISNIKTKNGMSRLDLLAHELCILFQKSKGQWIGEMEIVFNKPYTMPKGFLARIIRFQFKDVS